MYVVCIGGGDCVRGLLREPFQILPIFERRNPEKTMRSAILSMPSVIAFRFARRDVQ